MNQEMTSSFESSELRYNRSHPAPFQRQGACTAKNNAATAQSDISFHNTAICESIDLLMWFIVTTGLTQGLGVGRKI